MTSGKSIQVNKPLARGAAFLDRDSVINEEVNYLHEPEKAALLPHVAEALQELHRHGYLAIVVTNQAGIAKNLYAKGDMEAVHERLTRLLAEQGAAWDDLYYCPHHPDYTGECPCRKPHPGMLLQAIRDHGIDPAISFMVGDRASDIGAGIAAGCRKNYLVKTGYGRITIEQKETDGAIIADDLLAAVRDFFADPPQNGSAR